MKTFTGKKTPAGCAVTVAKDGKKPRKLPLYTRVVNHSLDHEWGYCGSGPAQLAAAILYDTLEQGAPGNQPQALVLRAGARRARRGVLRRFERVRPLLRTLRQGWRAEALVLKVSASFWGQEPGLDHPK